jgi:large subunit ribosomal protein L15
MKLNELENLPGSVKKRKRVGRGNGSGTGRTGGRGEKGQKSRSGVAIKSGGEQTSLIKRLPKRGFRPFNKLIYKLLNTDDLADLLEIGSIKSDALINNELLAEIGVIKKSDSLVKLLCGSQELQVKFNLKLDAYSKTARAMVEAAGGICN